MDLNETISQTAASASADKKPDPVELFHDMTLGTGKPLEVVSRTRLQVAPGVYVWSNTPFFVEVEKPTFVRGTEVLDERFARGWSNLPLEMKIKILSFDPVLNGNIERKNRVYVPNQPSGWKTLARYWAMTPEMGSLATQIFYETHNFKINIGLRLDNSARVFFPSRVVNLWIHRITVSVPLTVSSWTKLANFANTKYGFFSLKHAEIQLNVYPFFSGIGSAVFDLTAVRPIMNRKQQIFMDEIKKMPLKFRCDGNIEILYTNDDRDVPVPDECVQACISRLRDEEHISNYIEFGIEE